MKNQTGAQGKPDDYAAFLVRHKTLRLAGSDRLFIKEFDNLEEYLAAELLFRMKRYDPSVTKKTTFIKLILKNGISDMFSHRNAKRRDFRKPVYSLNERLPGDGGDGSMERLD